MTEGQKEKKVWEGQSETGRVRRECQLATCKRRDMVVEKTKEAREEKTGHLSDMQKGKETKRVDKVVIDIKEKRHLK